MRLFSILLTIFILTGCGYISIKSDDLSSTAIEKNVNAATGTATEGGSVKATGGYSTKYDEKSGGRAHNIKLAAKKLNETKIGAGETFSYNNCIGATGKSTGFKKARIFVDGRDSEGYGGGVCQVSSTLYNAVLEAGLTVVERYPHSKPVGYVPKNRDAATSYGVKDFKFKNDTENTLVINSSAVNGQLTVEIKSI